VTTGDYLIRMKAVGVKSLKARLSEYLRSVKSGETILVTERDEVIAELRPARGRWHLEAPLSSALTALSETGELTAPVLPKQGWSWKVGGLGLAPGSAAALLDEVRADRD
jgi:antitoxin (DNA-binding transcriptional repressor) of toxin-antitoxin stability system